MHRKGDTSSKPNRREQLEKAQRYVSKSSKAQNSHNDVGNSENVDVKTPNQKSRSSWLSSNGRSSRDDSKFRIVYGDQDRNQNDVTKNHTDNQSGISGSGRPSSTLDTAGNIEDDDFILDGNKNTKRQSEPDGDSLIENDIPVDSINNKTDRSTLDGDEEYEYVPLSEITGGFVGYIARIVSEYRIFFIVIAMIAICAFVILLIRNTSTMIFFISFALLAFLTALLIRSAWRERKEAKNKWIKAETLYQASKEKTMKSQEENDDEHIRFDGDKNE